MMAARVNSAKVERAAAMALIGAVLALLACAWALPGRGLKEADYARAWAAAHGGQCEVRNADGTRVDVLTATEAVEVEYAPKWAESIGQCLYYAAVTGKRPAVVLIVRGPQDAVYRTRIERVSAAYKLGIEVYEVAK